MKPFDLGRRISARPGQPNPPAAPSPVPGTALGSQPPPSQSAADVAQQLALETVRLVAVNDRIDLDFTPLSLSNVEQVIDRCSARGLRSATHPGFVFGLGCYFGEVVRRSTHNRIRWIFNKETALANTPLYQPNYLHLMLPHPEGEQFINVFNKIVARLDGDRGSSIIGYFRAVTTMGMPKSPPR